MLSQKSRRYEQKLALCAAAVREIEKWIEINSNWRKIQISLESNVVN
jgi:hypothetical protein